MTVLGSRIGMVGVGVLLGGTVAHEWSWGAAGWLACALLLGALLGRS